MKKVLVTGFGPFGQDTVNPALELVKKLDKKEFEINRGEKIHITSCELPVVFGKAIEEFQKAVKETNPSLILSIGQAGGRAGISLEKIGININDARIADNEGNRPRDQAISLDGPTAYFTTIDVRKSIQKLKERGIPAEISYSAGVYVCNNILYGALDFLAKENQFSKIKYGFIHIPYLPSQAATKKKLLPSMSLDLVEKAILTIIEVNI